MVTAKIRALVVVGRSTNESEVHVESGANLIYFSSLSSSSALVDPCLHFPVYVSEWVEFKGVQEAICLGSQSKKLVFAAMSQTSGPQFRFQLTCRVSRLRMYPRARYWRRGYRRRGYRSCTFYRLGSCGTRQLWQGSRWYIVRICVNTDGRRIRGVVESGVRQVDRVVVVVNEVNIRRDVGEYGSNKW